jgi:hypothetical protein
MGDKFPNYAAGSEGPAEAADILIQGEDKVEWLDFSKYDNICLPLDPT